jgi:hypothetical protein
MTELFGSRNTNVRRTRTKSTGNPYNAASMTESGRRGKMWFVERSQTNGVHYTLGQDSPWAGSPANSPSTGSSGDVDSRTLTKATLQFAEWTSSQSHIQVLQDDQHPSAGLACYEFADKSKCRSTLAQQVIVTQAIRHQTEIQIYCEGKNAR